MRSTATVLLSTPPHHPPPPSGPPSRPSSGLSWTPSRSQWRTISLLPLHVTSSLIVSVHCRDLSGEDLSQTMSYPLDLSWGEANCFLRPDPVPLNLPSLLQLLTLTGVLRQGGVSPSPLRLTGPKCRDWWSRTYTLCSCIRYNFIDFKQPFDHHYCRKCSVEIETISRIL